MKISTLFVPSSLKAAATPQHSKLMSNWPPTDASMASCSFSRSALKVKSAPQGPNFEGDQQYRLKKEPTNWVSLRIFMDFPPIFIKFTWILLK